MRTQWMGVLIGAGLVLTTNVASASPINFLTFNGASFTWTNNANLSGDLAASGSLTVNYNTANVTNLPPDLQGPIHGLISLSAHTTVGAVSGFGSVFQPLLDPAGGPYVLYTLSFTVDDAYYAANPTGGFDGSGYGAYNLTNLLTVKFTPHSDALHGVNRGITGGLTADTNLMSDGSFDPADDGNPDVIQYNSQFITFGSTVQNAFGLTFTQFSPCVTREKDAQPCTAPATGGLNAFLNSSVGVFVMNGGFDSDPPATYQDVPEPATILFGATGLGLVMFAVRRKRLNRA